MFDIQSHFINGEIEANSHLSKLYSLHVTVLASDTKYILV